MWHLFSVETKAVSPLSLSLPLNLLSSSHPLKLFFFSLTPLLFIFSFHLRCIDLLHLDFSSQIHDHRDQQQKGNNFSTFFLWSLWSWSVVSL